MANVFQSVGSGLEVAAKAISHFFEDAATIDKILHALTPAAKQAAVKVFSDLLVIVSDGGSAAAASGINFTLDAKVVADLQQVVSDAKAGIKQAEDIFRALNLPVPAAVAKVATTTTIVG